MLHIMFYNDVAKKNCIETNLWTSFCDNLLLSSNCAHNNTTKGVPFTPSDFIGFWVNSLVIVNGDQWRSNEFTGLMNGD
jgi:hypothetical protein